MSTLLFKVRTNKIRARTIFSCSLSIYDDVLVLQRWRWFRVHEDTITYNHVAQANIIKGLFFATLEIINSGGYENATIHHVLKSNAKKAKEIIDQKIYRAHSTGRSREDFTKHKDAEVHKFEKSLSRLKELRKKGKISKREFEKKRKKLIKSIG